MDRERLKPAAAVAAWEASGLSAEEIAPALGWAPEELKVLAAVARPEEEDYCPRAMAKMAQGVILETLADPGAPRNLKLKAAFWAIDERKGRNDARAGRDVKAADAIEKIHSINERLKLLGETGAFAKPIEV